MSRESASDFPFFLSPFFVFSNSRHPLRGCVGMLTEFCSTRGENG